MGTESMLKKTAYVTVAILFFSWLIDYVDRLVITLALPSIGKEFHLNPVEQGAIMSVFFFTYALFQLPGGILADKIGSKRTMTIAMVAWSAFTALTGAAANYIMLLAVRLLFGVSEGIFPGASMKAIAERTTKKTRSTANATMVASTPFGAAVAPLIAAPALIFVGWHSVFYLVAGFGVVMAVIMWFCLPRPLPPETTDELVSERTGNNSPSVSDSGAGIDVKMTDILKSGIMWKFFLMYCGMDIVSWGLVSWVPSYLLTVKHVSLAHTGALTSIPYLFGTIACALGGWLFDRYFYKHQRRIIVPSMIMTGLFLFLMLNSATAGEFIFFESFAVFFIWLTFQPILGLPMRLLSARVLGVGTAMVNFGGQVGGVIAPLAMGWLVGAFSYKAAFGFLVLGAVLAAACSMWIPESKAEFESAMSRKNSHSGLGAKV